MQELSAAKRLMEYYEVNPAQIRGRKVYFHFSKHQELATTKLKSNRVLLVTLQMDIQPVTVPINVDVVWQIFSPYGFVEKIVTLHKSAGFQALVQYTMEEYASLVMHALSGQAVYVGSDPIVTITLDIQYSNLEQLIVKQNTLDARDYTSLYNMMSMPSGYAV